jgi:ATP synthase F1 complex assembly factor 2
VSLDAAPWEEIGSVIQNSSQKAASSKNHNGLKRIESPISAGVDGTASATGVHHIPQNAHKNERSRPEEEISDASFFQQMITPRPPGKNSSTSSKSPSWYGVTLDGRTLSTPMGQKLAVPSKSLAYMIAAEWDAQTTRLQPSNMPFMTLACTTLDQAAFHPHVYRDEALKYLPTDTVRSTTFHSFVRLFVRTCMHACML